MLTRNVDKYHKMVITKVLQSSIMYIIHYNKTSVHPGGCKLYNTRAHEYYWTEISVESYALVQNFKFVCARNFEALKKLDNDYDISS